MPLVKAQCTNCGGTLEVDNSKDAAICPYCNTPYIVEQAINKFNVSNANINIQGANINVSGTLEADKMFENWIVTKDPETRKQLVKDFNYHYATDPRNEYMALFNEYKSLLTPDANKVESMIYKYFDNDKFRKYLEGEMAEVNKIKKNKHTDKIILIAVMALIGIMMLILLIAYIIY